MVYLMTMAQFSFRGHLASMGPMTKEREDYGVFGSCIKAADDLGEHLPATSSFLFKASQQGCGWLHDTNTPSFSSWPALCM